MTEPGFNLTPVDVRTQEFRRVLRGYDPEAVEDFRARVADEMERLIRDKAVLEERLQNARDQLKTFKEREKALNDALISAQQLRADVAQAAEREAQLVIREARSQADAVMQEARTAEQAVRRDTEAAQRHFTAYIAAFRTLLERYLSEVDALDMHTRDGSVPRP
ncbi:MAG TPA: DivIVA domain-containing protein [Gemmatimonadales bacterium]|nr:DivIVA domain-containing protein [Gemmatimonadales bacterium]